MSVLLESKEILTCVQQSRAISWDAVAYHAAKTGNLNILKLLSIEKEKIYVQQTCFEYACATGHKHIVNFFLDHLKQFQSYPQIYEKLIKIFSRRGFFGASKGGHLEIVQVIVEKYTPSRDDVKVAWECACSQCSWDVIFYLKEKFDISHQSNRGLYEACRGGHQKLVNWLIENGESDWYSGLRGACESGSVSLIQFMIERGATNIREGFEITCQTEHEEACKYLFEALHRVTPSGIRCLSYTRSVEIKKLLIECDETYAISIRVSDICPLLNEGVSLQKLLSYQNPHVIKQVVGLAEKLIQVVQLSLRGIVCADLINVLKRFIGYDVNAQVIEAVISGL